MTGFHPPLGQGEEFQRLIAQARRLEMHHGVMISGAMGVGKTTTAAFLARALLCEGDDPSAACDLDGAAVCSACRRIESHPDLSWVELPEEKEDIPVDLVRKLTESLQRAAFEGRARVVIVDPADRLNAQGQNALLKTLEEPGRSTFLLLPTRRPEGLLDTVRSRVAALRVLPLAEDDLRRLLAREDGADAAAVDFATAHAEGSLGLAHRLLDEENRHLFERISGFVQGLQGSPITLARAALEGASSRVTTVERARLALWMTRTILRNELWRTLADGSGGAYVSGTSVRWTTSLERLIDAETDLSLRIPAEQVLVHAFTRVHSPGCGMSGEGLPPS